jgi:hypothetical protein
VEELKSPDLEAAEAIEEIGRVSTRAQRKRNRKMIRNATLLENGGSWRRLGKPYSGKSQKLAI